MNQERQNSLAALEKVIGYKYKDILLLNVALTHTSYVKGDGKALTHNERLEFLGDAVLELCISEHLFKQYLKMDEGEMTRMRAQLVCEGSLFDVAVELNLGDVLQLGRGEDHSGGREKPSILSDALEAVIGSLYLDGGMEVARKFIAQHIASRAGKARKGALARDYKTTLQEYVQKHHLGTIRYELSGSIGPDHDKTFAMRVLVDGRTLGEGGGKNKQDAGQQAAKSALESLGAKK